MLSSVLGLSSAAGGMMSVAPMLPACPAVRSAPPTMQVQGGSRRTWSYGSGHPDQMDEMHVELGSDGRPMDAEFELWQGPGNSPVRSRVYGDNGNNRRVYASVGTGGRGYTNTASIQNTGPLEFPINAEVGGRRPFVSAYSGATSTRGGAGMRNGQGGGSQSQTIQGGALRTFTFDPSIGSVQVHCTSQGYPISANIEILQGPNSDRQGIELYSDDGRAKPVSYLLELPGYGSTIQIENTGPMTYPITVSVVPYGPQRMENSAYGYGGMMNEGMNGGMSGGGSPRYGRHDRYGRGGQRGSYGSVVEQEMATGLKWHERGQWGSEGARPRGPPPSFAEVEAQRQAGGPPSGMPFPREEEFGGAFPRAGVPAGFRANSRY